MDETSIFVFGPFRCYEKERTLFRGEEPIPLPPKAAQTLVILLRNAPGLVEKEDLVKEVWPDTFVEDGNLAHNISVLRKALGDDRNGNTKIETVPRRGYRFIAPLDRRSADSTRLTESASTRADGPAGLPSRGLRSTATLLLAVAMLVAAAVVATRVVGTSRDNFRSIAVLPFRTTPGNAMPQYFGVGLSDGIIASLSNSGQITVRPTSAVLRYASTDAGSAEIGRQLKVEAVLEGTVSRVGDEVRVSVQLVRVEDGTPLWAERLVEPYTSVFDLERSLADRIGRRLMLRISPEERRRTYARHTSNLEAYELYLQGRYFYYQENASDLRKALDCFRTAVQKDPEYALAWSGVAHAYVWLAVHTTLAADEAYPQARAAAQRALSLDEHQADAHETLALVLANYDWDWKAAERHFRRAIELNRNDALNYLGYSRMLDGLGRFDESIAANKTAQSLDPAMAGRIHTELSMFLLDAGRPDPAIQECQTALQLIPQMFFCHSLIGMAYTEKRMYPEALAEHRRAMQMNPVDPDAQALAAFTYAVAGQREEALRILRMLEERSRTSYVRSISFAYIHAALGNRDQSFAFLDKAVLEHDDYLPAVNVSPVFRSLQSDPRFPLLLARLNMSH